MGGEEIHNEDLDELKKATMELRKRFDTVQIFTTRHEGAEGTLRCNWGSGDYYARYGVARQWVDAQKLCDVTENSED